MKLKVSSCVVIFLMLLCCNQWATAQTYTPGISYLGTHGYTEYIPGSLPIIISAPHGGYLEPEVIPNRTCFDAVYATDAYTQELIRDIQNSIYAEFGCYAHVVINLLDRKKLDANRNLAEGACGNDSAKQAWNDFNDFLDIAENTVMEQYGKGLYIDLHGHGNPKQRLEIGYLLYDDELQLTDAELNTDTYINYSSIQHLVATNAGSFTHAELLRGAISFGTLMEEAGYASVPSAADPFPLTGDNYYSGGYNTVERSSYSGGTIDGFQIECNYTGVRDNTENRKRFADSITIALKAYLTTHYFIDKELSDCNQFVSIPQSDNVATVIGIYPNPSGQYLFIASAIAIDAVKIYTTSGTELSNVHFDITKKQIDISPLSPGFYFIRIDTGNFTSVQSFVKL